MQYVFFKSYFFSNKLFEVTFFQMFLKGTSRVSNWWQGNIGEIKKIRKEHWIILCMGSNETDLGDVNLLND